jgi:co-chaperonin GroES (HSP10)
METERDTEKGTGNREHAAFPRKPFLDRVIVREIPLKEIYRQEGDIAIPLDDARVKDQSDRGVVVAVGDCVPMSGCLLDMPVRVGDLVFFEDTTLYDPVYLNPADKRRSDLPRYWQIRVGDLKGYDVERRAALERGEDLPLFGSIALENLAQAQAESSALVCEKCGDTVPRDAFASHQCRPKESPLTPLTNIVDRRKGRRGLAVA